jgi:hypothetical protein
MKTQIFSLAAAAGLLLVGAAATADHNSKNGEGTANMPNDIHNTRVETLETDDNEAFKDFVRYGEGSETVNRFDSDDTQPNQAVRQKGAAETKQKQGDDPGLDRRRAETQSAAQSRNRVETRSRLESRSMDRMAATERGRSAARERGGRRH